MHLAIDAIGAKTGGAATVLLNILNVVLKDERFTCISLFCSPRQYLQFELPQSTKLFVYEQGWSELYRLMRPIWYEFFLERKCREIQADVVYCAAQKGNLAG